jgi:hypothetical protein
MTAHFSIESPKIVQPLVQQVRCGALLRCGECPLLGEEEQIILRSPFRTRDQPSSVARRQRGRSRRARSG